jgi:DNA mismatch endonuclease, patch repair protein
MRFGANAGYWREKISRNIERDRRNERDLAEAGWTLLRVWEHEPPDLAAARVAALLDERGLPPP